MRPWMIVTFGLALIALGARGASSAQLPAEEGRADVEGMMDAYVLSKLQESLDLSDDQFGRLVVAQKKLQDARRAYRRDRMSVLRQMRQTLRRDDAGAAELEPLLGELHRLRDDFATEEAVRYDAIDEILDVRQQARYRILEVELQRRLTEMMRQVRGSREQRGRQPLERE